MGGSGGMYMLASKKERNPRLLAASALLTVSWRNAVWFFPCEKSGIFSCTEYFTCIGIYLFYLLFADSEHEFHFDVMCQTSAPQNLTESANVFIRVTDKLYQGSQERLEGHMNNVCFNGALSDLQVQENLDLVNVPIAAFEEMKIIHSDLGDLRRTDCFTNMSGNWSSFVLSKLVKQE